MGFFNAVGQVITNQKTFKQWEKEDADKQKQREVLAQKGINQAELTASANKGKVIMDVIDIMDTHSEEVAENTETAIMPLAQSLPSLVSLLSMFGVTKFYTMPKGKAYDKATNNFIYANPDAKNNKFAAQYSKNGEELHNIAQKLAEKIKSESENGPLSRIKIGGAGPIGGTKLKESKYFSASELTSLFNKRNMDILSKSGDSEVQSIYKRLGEISKEFHNTKGIKNNGLGKIFGKSAGIIAAVSAVTFVAANIIAAKIQVKSSRIARWQSRQDLSDPKYFVQYTDEQIKQAENNLETNKEEKEDKGFSLFKNKNSKNGFKYSNNNGFFKSLFATIKDGKNYDEWKSNYNLEDKKVKRNLTPNEIKEAEKEQEVIQRITKIINNKAEEYSENMETTAGVLIGGTPFLGLGIGALINTFMTKTGLGDKFSDNQFNKLLKSITDETKKEELKKLYESIKPKADSKETAGFVTDFSEKMKGVKNIGAYFEKMLEGLESSSVKEKEGLSYVLNSMKDTFSIALTTKTARNTLIGFAGALITGTVGSLIGLKLQKSAARAGRYKAKRELEENKENFIGYTKEDFNSVNGIKAEKKPVLQKLGDYLMFIPRVLKDYFDYEKYKKTTADHDKELLNELVKLDVSENQLKEAKELQRKLFTTFESVDDKSQEYSEAIEAVSEMSQPILPYIGIIIASIPLFIGGRKLVKGGAPQAAESITGFFAKHTKFLKGKGAQKYTNSVVENIKGIVEKQQPNDKIAQNSASNILSSIFAGEGGAKLPSEIQNALTAAKGKDNELKAFLDILTESPALKKSLNQEELNKVINDLVNTITGMSAKLGENSSETDKIADEIKDQILPLIKDCTSISDVLKKLLAQIDIPNVKISQIKENAGILNSLGIKGFEEFKQGLKSNNIAGVANAVVEGKIQSGEWRTLLGRMTEDLPNSPAKTMLNKFINSKMSDEQALKIYQNIQTILKNVPKEELSKIINTALEEFAKNPAKFMQALQNGELKNILITKGVAVAAVAAPATWSAVSLLITFIVESIFASMQKQAGRLGVMKALEELEDTRFYADMEPKQNKTAESNTQKTETAVSFKDVGVLFNSLKK